MAVDPSKLSLKGLVLDPGSSTIGGTRNIYSNGVMEARVFLRWSYSAASEETTTVQDINNWLISNGQTHACGDNHTDDGALSGWTFYSTSDNTSRNGDKFVFDTKVVVPPVDEGDGNQSPGGSVWHLACYYVPPRGNTGTTNIFYFCPNVSKLTTLSYTYLGIESSEISVNSSSFTFLSAGKQTNEHGFTSSVYCLTYNPGATPADNSVYYLQRDWTPQSASEKYVPWAPDMSQVCGPINTSYLWDAYYDYHWKTTFNVIASRSSRVGLLALIGTDTDPDFDSLDCNYYPAPEMNALALEYGLLVTQNYGQTNTIRLAGTSSMPAQESLAVYAKGPMVVWMDHGNVDAAATGGWIDADIFPQTTENSYETELQCQDSFGYNYSFIIKWSQDGTDFSYPQWTVNDVNLVG